MVVTDTSCLVPNLTLIWDLIENLDSSLSTCQFSLTQPPLLGIENQFREYAIFADSIESRATEIEYDLPLKCDLPCF